MWNAQLDRLACPFCNTRLEWMHRVQSGEAVTCHGVVQCSCNRYPLTHNIINFGGKHQFSLDLAVRHLLANEVEKAVAVQIEVETLRSSLPAKALRKLAQHKWIPGNWVGRWRQQSTGPVTEASRFSEGVQAMVEGGFGDYLINRYNLPSFAASAPVAALLQAWAPSSILDLGCGAGHYTPLLQRLFPHAAYVGVDQHYANLFLGQRFLNLNHDLYICVNLRNPPPFKSEFDLIFASDILHTLSVNSDALIRYLDLLCDEGTVYIPRFDHSWGKHFVHPPTDCPDLLPDLNRFILDEQQVIQQCHQNGKLDLPALFDRQNLQTCAAYSVLYTPRPSLNALTSDEIYSILADRLDAWSLAPWYRPAADNALELIEFPPGMPHKSEWMHSIRPLLQDRISIPAGTLDAAGRCRTEGGLTAQLIRDFAVTLCQPQSSFPEPQTCGAKA